jgi:OmcA/MtrC family decaheme c-type cytochrome
VPYSWHAISPTENFSHVQYPGVLKDCETCHLPGTYNYAASGSAAALLNRQYRTVASGILASTGQTFTYSPYITQDLDYGAGFTFNAATGTATDAAATTLVTSPIATQCFACHDSSQAQAHIRQNGGSLYAPRSAALGTIETCMVCHDVGRIADIKVIHAK